MTSNPNKSIHICGRQNSLTNLQNKVLPQIAHIDCLQQSAVIPTYKTSFMVTVSLKPPQT